MAEAKTTVKKAPKKPAAKKVKKADATGKESKPKAAPKDREKCMFAVFATGGKQYRVSVGDKVKIEKIIGPSTTSTSSGQASSGQATYKEGDKLVFDNVLLTDNGKEEVTLGTPFINDSSVTATITKIGRAKKVEVVKYKAKSRYFKRYGHRQPYFEIQIESIK